nr:hypothetical protein [Allomuricauda sp.]
MQKLLGAILVCMVLLGCNGKEAPGEDITTEELVFNYQKMPKRTGLNPEATEASEQWPEFMELNNSFNVLYQAKNIEDLALAIDDLIDKENALAKSEYPEVFNAFQIKSRQRVLKTYLLKVKASILNNAETTAPTVEMIEAYNAMRSQFNVILNSQLDSKLILDEE